MNTDTNKSNEKGMQVMSDSIPEHQANATVGSSQSDPNPTQASEAVSAPSNTPRRRGVRKQVIVEPEREAIGESSVGVPWSKVSTHIDNSSAKTRGISLSAAMAAAGVGRFHCGDLVHLEVGIGTERYDLIGRASRAAAAYFKIVDLDAIGLPVHVGFNAVITRVDRVVPRGVETSSVAGEGADSSPIPS